MIGQGRGTNCGYPPTLIENTTNSLIKRKELIELVEKILVYKFQNYTREELDKMFTLTDFKKTRFYQDTFREGKLEGKLEGEMEVKLKSLPKMLALGIDKKQIASILELDLAFVENFIQQK